MLRQVPSICFPFENDKVKNSLGLRLGLLFPISLGTGLEDMGRWRFWMDRGGTFTDCLGISPGGQVHVAKVLSGPLAPLACIRQILELPEDGLIPPCDIRMGTTLATNALLERRGHPHALVITEGFRDALEIGTQQRPHLFDLRIVKPPVLYARVVEARERLAADGTILQPLDLPALEADLRALRAEGFDALAVVLLHGYAHPGHERAVAGLARGLGFASISCSHKVNPEIGFTARGDTTTVDACLSPLLAAYVETLRAHLPGSTLQFMQSGGGLTDASRFRGHNAILSGPAAGVVACARLADRNGFDQVIGFDMGGTSTDVCRSARAAEATDRPASESGKVYEWKVAGLRVRSPTLDIHTVAAGGGSLCRLEAGRLTVGPESAGSDPGPLCYGRLDELGQPKAGELAVTDVNFFLGRLLQDNFPFPLRLDRVEERMHALRDALRAEGRELGPEALGLGFLEVVNRQMAQAIKDISVARGREIGDHVLLCFGGAGGQHACAVARLLGIRKVLLHPFAGVLSALGMGLAETRWEGSAPASDRPLNEVSLASLEPVFAGLEERGRAELAAQGFAASVQEAVAFRRRLDLRYAGTEQPLTVDRPRNGDWLAAFEEEHRKLYGYLRPGRRVDILQARLEAIGGNDSPWPLPAGADAGSGAQPGSPLPYRTSRMVLRSGAVEAPVFRREDIAAGCLVKGPALILDRTGTVVLEEDFQARADAEGQLILEHHAEPAEETALPAAAQMDEPVLLELFNHAFMSIAERMGTVLQRTALSTNIKERLDFSCAVFDGDGALVANAPHIPVHLGAMGQSVRHVLAAWPGMSPGDAFATNNPYRGGSHLPDITVVTPVFLGDGAPRSADAARSAGAARRPDFFVANRAHHADVGGSTPGSMPAFSRTLEEEGILLDALRIARAGAFDHAACEAAFRAGPHPARNPADNLADLEAQVAANRTGASLLAELAAEHGLDRVLAQMGRLRANAARQVREALGRLPAGEHTFEDSLDDGTPVKVRITLGGAADGVAAVIDFTGTGAESAGNLNAPPAVVRSAVLYALRCLVAERIPLNEGCLDPVRIVLPEASLLNPSPGRAVVGGNVETSQRVVDVLLAALGLAAASQGTMNNITCGDGSFGYYETLAGGAGAGQGFHGASAVHTHMTNTRITDPEVLETRYPVRLERFSIRLGTGGNGVYRGGDGLIRHYRFLRNVQVSLLTQRRVTAPFGLEGGGPGEPGRNWRVTPQGDKIPLAHAVSYEAEAGERLIIETPGGGGWGPR
jgi:5-oxoprolinase (ATP-hydrolysing)